MSNQRSGSALQVDLSSYVNQLGWRNKLGRALWGLVYYSLFRFSPRPLHFWRLALLRLFGAQIDEGAHVYPSARIWAPWNLRMGRHSCLSFGVECYNVAPISLGDNAAASQYAVLCAASHDISDPGTALIAKPIDIGNQAWVFGWAFVGPGVRIGEGAVVAARAVVVTDVPSWTVVGGNPAKPIKQRALQPRDREG